MDLLITTYQSLQLSGMISASLQEYHHTILLILLGIALLNCFLGFHLRKLWGILAGMAIGACLSAAACLYIEKTGTILYIVTVLGAMILGLLALLLYRAGLFFICVLLIPLILNRLFPAPKTETLILWIILGMAAGGLALIKERDVISVVTSTGGGFGAARCIMLLQDHPSSMFLILLGIVLSTAGLLLQFQPWRSRSSWNSDEERVRDRHRHKRRMKRIQKKKKQLQRMEQLRKRDGSGRHWSPMPKTDATEYIPYRTHPIYQEHLQNSQTDSADLSGIRQNISREVSDIYREQQQDMDRELDRLLEEEYRKTTKNLGR